MQKEIKFMGSPPKVGAPGVSVSRNKLLLLDDNC